MSLAETQLERLTPQPLPDNICSTHPGGGLVMRLELAWGRLRRARLRLFRPRYVRRMYDLRRSQCPNCRHDVIDSRDLKFCRNVCGYYFDPVLDPFAWRNRLPLARAGLAELLTLALVMALLTAAGAVFAPSATWFWILAASSVIVVGWGAYFFRDPPRRVPSEPGLVVAPADGLVVEVEELDHLEGFDGRVLKIGIFLSILNVHINRSPLEGRVIELRYLPGKFFNAMRPRSAGENEQLWLTLEEQSRPHRRVLVKQIAGAIARRIVCEARPGEVLNRGQKFGMIKFGSRTELYLPVEPGLQTTTRVGDRVRAGVSVLARFGG